LEEVGRSWKKLEEVGRSWKKLEEVGRSWKGAAGDAELRARMV